MPDPSAILLCAATPWEARPIARALGLLAERPALWTGTVGVRRAALLETGIGAAAAKTALERAYGLANGSTPALVLSTGLCGALQPGLRTGDIVMDLHGAPLDLARRALGAAERGGVRLHVGSFAHADRVLSPADKRALGLRTRAAAVDMESAAIRSWAETRGSGFLTARAVLDALEQTAPSSAPDGEDLRDILSFLWRHAGEVPALVAAGLGARRAMDALGRFLAEYLGDDAADASPA
ncbi:MAG: hypothetical protein HY928_12680 [Elusimicrobia bacterium]|nr:hypothetical protein [Elusimicrobiota bacterium]